jgi:quinol monooxygenase YgiN
VSVVVIATIHPLPEHRADVLAAFTDAIGQVHAEDGCELYALHEGPDRIVMVEKWASPQALKTHGTGPALQELGRRLDGKLSATLDVQVLTPLPAGDPTLGTV